MDEYLALTKYVLTLHSIYYTRAEITSTVMGRQRVSTNSLWLLQQFPTNREAGT